MSTWNWFYEKMSPMGRWQPQVSADEPMSKGSNGPIKIRNVQPVAEEDQHLSFRDLIVKYSPQPEVPAWATHRHVKSGGFYKVTGEGRLEVTGDDAYPLVEYENGSGQRFAQRAERFHDGRFQAVPMVQPAGE